MMTKLTGMYRIRCVTTMICSHTYIGLTIAIVGTFYGERIMGSSYAEEIVSRVGKIVKNHALLWESIR